MAEGKTKISHSSKQFKQKKKAKQKSKDKSSLEKVPDNEDEELSKAHKNHEFIR